MEPILQSQIFFFITSIFVVILTIVLIIGGFYLIRILKNISDMSTTLKGAVDNANSELAQMGDRVRESKLYTFIFGKKKEPKRAKHRTAKPQE